MFLYQKFRYNYKHIDTSKPDIALKDLTDFLNKAKAEKTDYIAYDTETNGLNIITSKPFLVSMGFNNTVITMEYNPEVMNNFWKLYLEPDETGKCIQDNDNYIGLFAHNGKFDYHIVKNGGSRIPDEIRIYDSITIARLTEYTDERASMSLESLGSKYVDETSKFAGKIIKDILKKINLERRKKLRTDLINTFPDDEFSITNKLGKTRQTGKLTRLIEEYDKTRTRFVNDDNVYFKFIDEHYTPATYQDAYNQEPSLVRSYAADDIVIMLEYMKKAMPTLRKVDTGLVVLNREGKLIRAVATLESAGIKVNVDYVLNCRQKMCKYRDLLYLELNIYTGLDFKVGQNDYIKKFLYAKYGIKTDKVDEKALKYIKENTTNDEVKCICSNILELRTLDKWISTYVDGKLNSMIYDEKTKAYRIYTDINNNGAVSGRVSCDMQQQPKEALFDRDGNELFHPRKMFICDTGYKFAFCDESQMELRIQAYYTVIHSSEPDLSMCRAYEPYKCYRLDEQNNKITFNQHNTDDIKNYAKYEWYQLEDDILWKPTDLHSETTKHAFPNIPVDSPEFKKKRKLGKRANFLKVYQGGVNALMSSLDIDRGTAEALDNAFYKAFPRIKDYQEWVVEHLSQYGYVENLYGRRYYMDDSRFFYRACNYLIQGTCADMVKLFEIKVYEYLKENNLKSKMLLPIHDELMLDIADDEMFVIKEVKRIMEDVTDIVKSIPMISEPEVSSTNWAEKKDYVIQD